MDPRRAWSAEWLLNYSEQHIAYEFRMLRRLAFLQLPSENRAPTYRRAVIEAFALHLRAIVEFFSGPRGDTEVIAEDFCSDGSPWDHDRTKVLGRQRRWASQQVLHLTAERDGSDRGAIWKPLDAITLLVPIIKAFLDIADDARLHARARDEMNHLLGPYHPEHPEQT